MPSDNNKRYPQDGSNSTGRSFPSTRLRRNRRTEWSRRLVKENTISIDDLIWPLFICEGSNKIEPVSAMPGVFRYSIDTAVDAIDEAKNLGIPAIALFPHVEASLKDSMGKNAVFEKNLICNAIKEIKTKHSEIGIQCDVALDPYTSHGHDGLIRSNEIINDETIEILINQSLLQAEMGCDVLAPSDMMDGRVRKIRKSLDKSNYQDVLILSYAYERIRTS